MKKVFEWVKGAAMVALAIVLIGGEALFWKAWEATAAGVRWLWRQTKAVVGLALRVTAVTAFIVALSMAFLFAPRFLPVPNAWAENMRGGLQAISSLTGVVDNILSSNGALFTFGQLFPAEITSINRMAWVAHDSCTVLSGAATTVLKNPGPGNVAKIIFMSGTAASLILYDNTAASGTKLYDNSAIGVTPSTSFLPPPIPLGAAFGTGLTAVVAGTAPVVGVCFL